MPAAYHHLVMHKFLAAASAALLFGCAATPASFPPSAQAPIARPAQPDCGLGGSRDWKAWINAMPGPGTRPTLIITGKVETRSGATRVEWRDFRVMESYPVQVAVEVQGVEPVGVSGPPVVLTLDARGEWPIEPPVGSLTIRCGNEVVARIAPVETAH